MIETLFRPNSPSPFVPESKPRKLLAETANHLLIWNLEVNGLGNLERTQELAEKGYKIILTPNHLSNADGPVIDRALRETGPKGFAENVVYIQGRKLDLNPINRYFTRSLKVIKIWPPSLKPTPEEEQLKKEMNEKAIVDAKKCFQVGYYLAVFFEGGRSYAGSLKQAERSPLQFFTLVDDADTVALPVGVWGTEKAMPPHKIPRPTLKANVSFGEPRNISALIRERNHLSGTIMRKQVVDIIMRKEIAPLLPPKYRGVYA